MAQLQALSNERVHKHNAKNGRFSLSVKGGREFEAVPSMLYVNAKLNSECFVCRWHGGFDHDPESVEEGLIDLLEQCPELIDCIQYIPRL
ncbi:MAG: hypothetical protein ACR2HJ_06845 [Fimbriimonadales bacterium]